MVSVLCVRYLLDFAQSFHKKVAESHHRALGGSKQTLNGLKSQRRGLHKVLQWIRNMNSKINCTIPLGLCLSWKLLSFCLR